MVESDYTRLVTTLINDDSKFDEIERLNNVIKSWEIQLKSESFPIFKFIIEQFRFYSEKNLLVQYNQLIMEFHFWKILMQYMFPLEQKTAVKVLLIYFQY